MNSTNLKFYGGKGNPTTFNKATYVVPEKTIEAFREFIELCVKEGTSINHTACDVFDDYDWWAEYYYLNYSDGIYYYDAKTEQYLYISSYKVDMLRKILQGE